MAVKKSIYLDAELDEALKASAKFNGRSVTKEIDFLLREALSRPRVRVTSPYVNVVSGGVDWNRDVQPDPKVKPFRKPAKKLT